MSSRSGTKKRSWAGIFTALPLAVSGFACDVAASISDTPAIDDLGKTIDADAARFVLRSTLNDGPKHMFAAHKSHSSHRSHSSHSSHSSHYSSSGARSYPPPPPAQPAQPVPQPPRQAAPIVTPPTDPLVSLVMRVQLSLNSGGHCACEVTGKMDESTRQGLKAFQTAQGLRASGLMDNETLSRLGIKAP